MSLAKTRRFNRIAITGAVFSLTLPAMIPAQSPPTSPLLSAAAWIPNALPAAAPSETVFFPLAQVHAGLRGVAYTVFQGVTPEPMEVEILGVLHDALGPRQDMILARLHGSKPEYTGVVAGMSGSPVYIDGRLVGALSYRIGQFSREPIAGITPIESMLEVRDTPPSAPAPAPSQTRTSTTQPNVTPMETPLVFSGFSADSVDRFGDRFRALGLTPVVGLGGTAARGTHQPAPLVPGSAVSAILVQGDLNMAGTCTVTYVDQTRLLACGHPITQYGPVSMPMTKADVVATLPSPLNAFKIVNTTDTVGAFTEDRSSAILGRFGVTARMIPVSVEVSRPNRKPTSLHFEVLDNRQLTPSAMLVTVYQSMQQTNGSSEETTYHLTGELTIADQPPVHIAGMLAPTDFNSGAINTALYVGERFQRIYGNSLDQPTITGLSLHLEALPERRTAVIDTARLSRTEARPGDTIEVEATLHPFQSTPTVVRIPLTLPASLTPGTMRVLISDAATLDRLTSPTNAAAAQHAIGLTDTITQVNRLHPNDRVYCTLLDHEAQALLESGSLPSLPLSMANVLQPLKETQRLQLTGESILEAGSAPTGYATTGSQVLTLTIR